MMVGQAWWQEQEAEQPYFSSHRKCRSELEVRRGCKPLKPFPSDRLSSSKAAPPKASATLKQLPHEGLCSAMSLQGSSHFNHRKCRIFIFRSFWSKKWGACAVVCGNVLPMSMLKTGPQDGLIYMEWSCKSRVKLCIGFWDLVHPDFFSLHP